MRRVLSVGFVLLLLAFGAGRAVAEGEFTSGRWTGQAFDDGGRFTHCAMLAPYVSRWTLLFSVDRNGDVGLGLQHAEVGMLPWEQYKIFMQVDNDPVITPAFKSPRSTLLMTKFAADSEWIKRLRKGKKLKVNVGKRVPNFDLEGFNEAMGALYACAKKYRGA